MDIKEQKILANIRNKYSPVLNYFKLKKELESEKNLGEYVKKKPILDGLEPLACECAIDVAKLLKSLK